MENDLKASSFSIRSRLSSSNAKDITAKSSEEEYFVIGNRRPFSHTFSFSEEDLRSLNIEDNTTDESSQNNESTKDNQESTSSIASTSECETQQNWEERFSTRMNELSSPDPPQWRGFFKKLTKGSKIGLHTFNPSMSMMKILSRKKTRSARKSLPVISDPTLDSDLYCLKSSWKTFSLSQLEDATNNFNKENLIGEGGYSEVYKGHLENGQLVAIKRLTRGRAEEMTADFLSELGMLVHANHPNIANAIGYGVEGGMHLVLHLSPHGSLASLLTGAKEKLEWGVRYKIALGTAEGLSYLHEGCQRRIIHRDIKAANILLTEDFEAKISDFGLAKWLPEQWTHLTITQVEGTFGYLPPEFFLHGIVDEKTDVYSYGVLLLELISGRLALDKSKQSLVMWAKPLLTENSIREIIDPSVSGAYNENQLHSMVLTASVCLHESPEERPRMGTVVQMLKGKIGGSLTKAKKFQRRPAIKRACSVGNHLEAEDFNNSTNYLNDNKPMQIALGL